MKDLFLVIAGMITVGSVAPYIRDILKKTTKPNIVSWMTWTLLTGVATVAEFSAHEYRTAIFTGSAMLAVFSVVVLGLKYGRAKYTLFDAVCQLSTVIGLALWAVFNNPAAAVIFSVAIDFIGALPTIRHAWLSPHEETWSTYGLAGVGAVFAILALHRYNWTSLTLAAYVVIVDLFLCTILIIRGRIKR